MPQFSFIPTNTRLEAGKFAIELQPLAGLDEYTVNVHVGLHPNAAQFLSLIPAVSTVSRNFRAIVDEIGFHWVDTNSGLQHSSEDIVGEALSALSDLLIADHAGKLDYGELDV